MEQEIDARIFIGTEITWSLSDRDWKRVPNPQWEWLTRARTEITLHTEDGRRVMGRVVRKLACPEVCLRITSVEPLSGRPINHEKEKPECKED